MAESLPAAAVPLVPTSVMPKGVEHLRMACMCKMELCVPTSVMPKGVEHYIQTSVDQSF